MTTLEIRMRTLTPLWTGGVDQTCDRLHETGLIGSLRWWYEALVRGLGGSACDPTGDSRCEYDPKKPDPPEKQLCAVCYVFGCTGWTRRFRLQVESEGNTLLQQSDNVLIPSGRVHQSKGGQRAGGWYVFGKSRVGTIGIRIIPLCNADLRPLHTILTLINQHASLGPKGASGYGIIQVENVQPDVEWMVGISNRLPARNNSLPDFRDFFFASFRFQAPKRTDWWRQIDGIQQAVNGKLPNGSSPRPLRSAYQELEQMYNQGVLPVAPAIRNWLRFHWQHGLSARETHFVFGEAQAVCPLCYQPGFRPDRNNSGKNWCPNCKRSFKKGEEVPTTASKINVSYAYRLDNSQWEFRLWGWLPCAELDDRDSFLNALKEQFQSENIWKLVFGERSGIAPGMKGWHALDCSQTDGPAYLKELLGGAP